jgi:hypothetical protein
MKNIVVLVALLLLTLPAMAQRKCGTTLRHLQMLQNDPSVLQHKNALEQEIQRLITYTQQAENQLVVTIPVVVHVVYPSTVTAANITDAQIQSQITALNRDYAKTNTDASSTPAVWSGLAANTQIQFCLARRTPAGATTTGITRRSTSRANFDDRASRPDGMDEIKKSTYGTPNWDRTKYLNIWVGKLDDQTLGYAYFPSDVVATADAWLDGVVIDYRCFGDRVGTAGTGAFTAFNLGRTLTHEAGHYFNLSHIWGDDLTASETDCESDNVTDTPPQLTANVDCPTYPHNTTDVCNVNTHGNMFMNYMDYSDDACLYMFTTGQSNRMNAAITASRAGLLTSNGCSAPINVEMTYFKGDNQGKVNRLTWETATESNNDFFDVERSFDGKNYQSLGRVKGHGTTSSTNNYDWTDPSVSGVSVVYYRLKQVDFDGTFAYSNVVALVNKKAALSTKIFPNPVSNTDLTVQFSDNSRKTVSLTDALGRVVFLKTIAEYGLRIPTVGLSAGLYFCSIQGINGAIEVQKVVVR